MELGLTKKLPKDVKWVQAHEVSASRVLSGIIRKKQQQIAQVDTQRLINIVSTSIER